jgi:hypothetical protein
MVILQVAVQKKGELITSFFNKGKAKRADAMAAEDSHMDGDGAGPAVDVSVKHAASSASVATSVAECDYTPSPVPRLEPSATSIRRGAAPTDCGAAVDRGWACASCTFRNEGEGAEDWLQCSVCLAERVFQGVEPAPGQAEDRRQSASSAAKASVGTKRGERGRGASSKRKAPAATTPLEAFLSKRHG